MLSNVFERDGWYYFQYPGGDCNIGPFRSQKECENACIAVYTTGFIAPPEKVDPDKVVKCIECEGLEVCQIK